MLLIHPLIKGHVSNEDKNYLAEGVTLLEGDYCSHTINTASESKYSNGVLWSYDFLLLNAM